MAEQKTYEQYGQKQAAVRVPEPTNFVCILYVYDNNCMTCILCILG